MSDVRSLVLVMSEEVQTHPLVLAAIKDASQWAKLDGFEGVPEYDEVRAVIETVAS